MTSEGAGRQIFRPVSSKPNGMKHKPGRQYLNGHTSLSLPSNSFAPDRFYVSSI
jgi:hypothetical protein